MTQPATGIYEIVIEETTQPKRLLRTVFTTVTNMLNMFNGGPDIVNPGGRIISVVHTESGEELFRHIEDMGDDEDSLLRGIKNDLNAMTATAFAERWS